MHTAKIMHMLLMVKTSLEHDPAIYPTPAGGLPNLTC